MGLRLVADDLTGALDSAARLVPAFGPIPTFLAETPGIPPVNMALDAATRDAGPDIARAAALRLAPLLAEGDPAFRKLDSLLRGHVAVEIAAAAPLFQSVVIAPAFPYQGRMMRGGRQYSRTDSGEWRDTGVNLTAELAGLGIKASTCVPGQAVPGGVSLWDAATDAELDRIVAARRDVAGKVLWCGTGGLAGALAGHRPVPLPRLPRPLLALVGSDQPVSRAQLATLGRRHRQVTDAAEAGAIADLLRAHGDLAVSAALAPGLSRAQAERIILPLFTDLLNNLSLQGMHPGTLFVTGGATLRGVALALGATRLDVDGELVPGVPTSILRGGAWEGQRVVSKSGAFGDAGFLARIMG
jgi:uncharacterized protein YgbK (DUF1537 family)